MGSDQNSGRPSVRSVRYMPKFCSDPFCGLVYIPFRPVAKKNIAGPAIDLIANEFPKTAAYLRNSPSR